MEKLNKRISLFESSNIITNNDIILELGYDNLGFIGRGVEGSVYDIGDEKVIKIAHVPNTNYAFYTIDEELLKNPSKHFNKIYDTKRLHGYEISIKEKVKTGSKYIDEIKIVEFIRKYVTCSGDFIDHSIIAKLHFCKIDDNAIIDDYIKSMIDMVSAAAKLTWSLGIESDIGISNIGVNNKGDVVAIDA